MIEAFHGQGADEVWQMVATRFRDGTNVRSQSSRAGETNEILHAVLSVANPRDRWVISRRPAMNVAFAIAEIVWIMAARNDLAFLKFWNKQYGEHVGHTPILHGAYGHRLRSQFKMDQLSRAFAALKNNKNSRQVVLQIWNAPLDMPATDGAAVNSDIPCNIASMLKIRDGKLEWMQVLRSNDVFLGLPHNLVQFTYLQEIIAGWLEVEPGTYNQVSDSLHVYDRNAKDILMSIPKQVPDSAADIISVPKETSDILFAELSRRADRLTRESLSEAEIQQITIWEEAPVGYRNLLTILTAEAARRMSYQQLAFDIGANCQNVILGQLWQNWWERVTKDGVA